MSLFLDHRRICFFFFFFFNDTATTEIYTLSLHDALPICARAELIEETGMRPIARRGRDLGAGFFRSEEHTSELQSRSDLVCRLLLEKKKKQIDTHSCIRVGVTAFLTAACDNIVPTFSIMV